MIGCKNITKTYRSGSLEATVIRGVTFCIKEGEFVAIMGPSGSGKSTIMHILGMLDTPTSGTYEFCGENVSALPDDELADIRKNKIGFVFQSFNLLPRTTVIRNVALPLMYAGVPRGKREGMAAKALELAGLDKKFHGHLSNQLSGGQMQRVAIARALVNNPSLILADEPTGNLDTKTGRIVLDTFQALNEKQKHTIVLITHELSVAECAGRIIQICDGAIVDDRQNNPKRNIFAGN